MADQIEAPHASVQMDIRELASAKPALGRICGLRFDILHNLRTLDGLEAVVVDHLQGGGPIKIATKRNLFVISLDSGRSHLVIQERPGGDGMPFQTAPAPLQLLCNELLLLHRNQEKFSQPTADEIRQILLEFTETASEAGLIVTKGGHHLRIHLQADRLEFEEFV